MVNISKLSFKLALRYIIWNKILTRTAAYLGDNTAITETIYRDKLFVDVRDLSLTPHILLNGLWEGDLSELMIEIIRKLNREGKFDFIDIGANIGWYTILIGKRIRGITYSFEPSPRPFELLFRNIEINGLFGKVIPENKAVMNKTIKRVKLKIPKRHHGSASIFLEDLSKYLDEWDEIEVDAISLDEYVKIHQKVGLMKIDAEGAEPYIFEGAEEIISSSRHLNIVMEFSPKMMQHYEKLSDFIDFLFSNFEVKELKDFRVRKVTREYLQDIDFTTLILKKCTK
mgnify:CR=1 FL=1